MYHLPFLLLSALFMLEPARAADRLGFIGLHGGVFSHLQGHAPALKIEVVYHVDADLASGKADLGRDRLLFVQHLREEDQAALTQVLNKAVEANPALRILPLTGEVPPALAAFDRRGVLIADPKLAAYYTAGGDENLRRLLIYALATYAGGSRAILPPEDVPHGGLFHPDHPTLFPDAAAYLKWARETGRPVDAGPRVVVVAHYLHLTMQQPAVVEALVRALEKRGALAVAVIDNDPAYAPSLRLLKPQAIIHTCHSSDPPALREELGVPHLHSVFFRKQSIEDWRGNVEGLASNEIAFQLTSQELLGAVEPQAVAGTHGGGGTEEAFTPIPDRVAHLVDRTLAWARLGRLPSAEKKVAFVYYDREMGKSELMRGSPTGMMMNAPRSMVRLLGRMKADGYGLTEVPDDDQELIDWMQERGRQIGVWAPEVLDKLARSGDAVLVPAEQYREWFERKVPEPQRQQLIEHWGEPPGRFLVWKDDSGQPFIVIPRIDLGNVILLPQPLRGEAHDPSLVHDKLVPPPHNYLATYFWLQEGFKADAMVHFGTHGTEFILPGKAAGLSAADWPDIVIGAVPNINLWVIHNLGESLPVRRRAYATLVDHLVPPSVPTALADALLNVHQEIDKWSALEPGALKEKFRLSVTESVRKQNLDKDLKLDLSNGRTLSPTEIDRIDDYLHSLETETIQTRLHILGEPPADEQRLPYMVYCVGRKFREALTKVVPGAPRHDREKWLETTALKVLTGVLRGGLTPPEAIAAARGRVPGAGLPKVLADGFALAKTLDEGFNKAPQEIDNLLAALAGRFIPPGPGNSPDRNPGSVPTGRNMFLLNPDEVPARAAWEIGRTLVDEMLAEHRKTHGALPPRVAFDLSSMATFQDYGVMEAQILYLLGVRPVWDARNLVSSVEPIPRKELGRPRIDVFIQLTGYYRDLMPTRIELIDDALRLAAAQDEPDNPLRKENGRIATALVATGIAPEKADRLAQMRIFGHPPGQNGSANHYYLVERSGQWDARDDLIEAYIAQARYAYGRGVWGENAPVAYKEAIQGSEIVVRSLTDRARTPLVSKYNWLHGGSLSLVVKHLTGKEPEFLMSDLRDPEKAHMVSTEDALRTEWRVRLFNRAWIEGMKKEGYAGADQMAVLVSNTMGWKIMREKAVTDDVWNQIVDVYVRDSLHMDMRSFFETNNPFAFQEVTELLLESARKGYWSPDKTTLLEVAQSYARSVIQHGEGGGLRGGANTKLDTFVQQALKAPGTTELNALAEQLAQAKAVAPGAPGAPGVAGAAPAVTDQAKAAANPAPTRVQVEGQRLAAVDSDDEPVPVWVFMSVGVALLVALGAWRRAGSAR